MKVGTMGSVGCLFIRKKGRHPQEGRLVNLRFFFVKYIQHPKDLFEDLVVLGLVLGVVR